MEPKLETTMSGGRVVDGDHRDIDPSTGMQKGYVVLSEAERAKGFVRPVRTKYVHVGPSAPKGLRDLTDEEKIRYAKFGYSKYEQYNPPQGAVLGKFWTQAELDRQGKGCGVVTKMADDLAETYARKPDFYSGTFCVGCKKHYPVGENGEFVWDGTDIRVGT